MIEEQFRNLYDIVELFGSKVRVKIMKELVMNQELSISQIIKKTKSSHTCVLKHLVFLKTQHLVQEKTFGRTRIFRFKIENYKAKALKNLIEIYES